MYYSSSLVTSTLMMDLAGNVTTSNYNNKTCANNDLTFSVYIHFLSSISQ